MGMKFELILDYIVIIISSIIPLLLSILEGSILFNKAYAHSLPMSQIPVLIQSSKKKSSSSSFSSSSIMMQNSNAVKPIT